MHALSVPALPTDRPARLLGSDLWSFCREDPTALWAFGVIQKWAVEDQATLVHFYADFKQLEEHYSQVRRLLKFDRENRYSLVFDPRGVQGSSEYQHLLLLSLCGRGWHHLVGDILEYTIGIDQKRIQPFALP